MRRIGWIDYGKVIGIYLVVLAHTSLFIPLKDGIYTFLMPVFFFISGYLFSFSRNPVYKDFIKKPLWSNYYIISKGAFYNI